ncbi:hypothetical protein CPB86DRAFT_790424 [Serendipita vermifera]|nr:hypothetical protein CPB86DRAFT_790424 [Serendipita vermifera]
MSTNNQLTPQRSMTVPISTEGLNPIQRLPPELLKPIFELLDPDFAALVKLMAVSRQWRELILNTPTLWNIISIHAFDEQSTESFEALISRLRLQFKCSGTLPLYVHWATNINEHRVNRLIHLIGEMAPFDRWKALALCTRGIIRNLSPGGRFTKLETIRLLDSSDAFLYHIDQTATQLRMIDAPLNNMSWNVLKRGLPNALKRASTICLPGDVGPFAEIPPNITRARFFKFFPNSLPNITTLECTEFWGESTILDFLPRVQKIRTAEWYWIRSPAEVTSKSLRHLVILSGFVDFLDYLITPNLQTLEITDIKDPNSTPRLPQSWSSCKHLVNLILDLPLDIDSLVPALESMTLLENLTIRVDSLEKQSISTTLAAQDCQASGETLWKCCPVLEHLAMRASPGNKDILQWQEEVLNVKRVRSDGSLKTVRLEVRQCGKPDDRPFSS